MAFVPNQAIWMIINDGTGAYTTLHASQPVNDSPDSTWKMPCFDGRGFAKFTEGYETPDLVAAKTILDPFGNV